MCIRPDGSKPSYTMGWSRAVSRARSSASVWQRSSGG
eukprot:GSChrysophyteH1.ASY1.ANO1.3309.1 assembled CDS